MVFNITLLPDNSIFTAEAGKTIMEAAKKHGHNLPLGCADGACGICKGSVLQGTVNHGKSTVIALSAEDREAGLALFCCAIPTSDLVIQRREMVADWTILDWNGSME